MLRLICAKIGCRIRQLLQSTQDDPEGCTRRYKVMRVILKEDVYKHGVAGEIVKVADGFARNWLIPKGMALPASKANMEQMVTLREQATQNRAIYNDRVNAAAQQINGVELVFGVKAGSNNKLYGSITSQMIKDALMEKT